ncbi:amino acid/polyamine/organocation transporter, APC superfamily [Hymenobacter daecheongensis DSM 21074]|uniref:Amino acid/polyamine/organocation transporter, APC superfamily n=1 Tax=Hymenobacter daecheongensis DSM 21074 TaxID=1121955 RepID=A0A1M6AIY6_9BACT|nr:APC family permease [Hymenobacter daecheongensis]SHI36426.1 amino acid/polyamine/organocation transporter, APC superfamily [Hymenobacter daecheongensis DSM 21074]
MTDTSTATTAAAPLRRRLGLLQATALNMIDMVGIGPFVTLPLVMGMMGPYFLLAWLVGAGLAVVDGMIWSELGAAHPEAGGSYRFLKLAYGEQKWGRLMSFLYVWQTLVQAPLVVASGAIGFAQYFGYLVPFTAWWQPKLVSGVVVLALIGLLYRRIEDIGRLGVLLWVGVLGLMAWLIFGGLTHSTHTVAWLPTGGFGALPGLLLSAAMGQAAVKTVYSYLGYYNVCHLGGEIKNPQRVIPRSIFLSILGIAGLYLLLNWSVGTVIPWQEAQHSEFIVSTFVERLYGAVAAQWATALVLWVAFASLFAVLLGYSRIPYAAAADGEFLPLFAKTHPTKHFPHVSLLILGGLGFVFSLLFRIGEVITAILAMRILVQFVGQAVGLVLLRRREGKAHLPFRMPLYPLPVVVAVAVWLLIFWSTGPAFMLSGLTVISTGVIVFLLWSRRLGRWPFGG